MARKSEPSKKGLSIKKGDTVKVIAGRDKGAEGKVIGVLRDQERVIVEGDAVARVGFRREDVTKRRPDGSTYSAERSVRISRKTGKDI